MRSTETQKEHHILYARLDLDQDDVVILRVVGRGDHEISPQIKAISDRCNTSDHSPRYIFDLEHCPAMDSTFMGVIAAIALHQIACDRGCPVVLNADATTQNQLDKLGLKYLLDMHRNHSGTENLIEQAEFEETPEVDPSRFDRIVHMIESHEALIEADSGNEVKFRLVLQSLSDSLAREKEEERKKD